MFRKTLLTPQSRRCSGAVVAAATAALVLAPGVAFAAGQPAGPGTGHSVGAGTGHTGGHTGSRTGSHKSGRSGHSASRTTRHTGSGHATSHKTGHTGAGHRTTSGRASAHGTNASAHRGGAGTASDMPGSASGTNASGMPGSSHGSGGMRHPGMDTSPSMAETVTKLSVSKAGSEDGTLIMVARVSTARRTAGAGPATGTVEFSVDGTSSGPIPLSGGRAMVKAELGPGEHTASAKYSGDAEHAPSSSEPVGVTAD